MHDQPPWINKLLFPPAIKSKRSEPTMTDLLAALTKRVAELRQAGLEAFHCIEEFYLQWIHPLGRQKKLAFECPRMADPYHKPLEGCLFVFFSILLTIALFRSDISFYMMQLYCPKK
jgi:hypothetical protein